MPEPDPHSPHPGNLAHPDLDEILSLRRVDSTNLEARRIRTNHLGENVLVTADEQTAGRGQQGRSWLSGSELGIYASLLLQRSSILELPLNLISLYTGLTIQKALQEILPMPVQLKWPNDVLVGSRKIAGILTELQWLGSRPHSVIVGFGLNLNHTPSDFPVDLIDSATSILLEIRENQPRNILFQRVLDHFFKSIGWLEKPEKIMKSWNAVAWKMKQVVQYAEGASIQEGQLLGVDEEGFLRLRTASGIKRFSSGEIRLIR